MVRVWRLVSDAHLDHGCLCGVQAVHVGVVEQRRLVRVYAILGQRRLLLLFDFFLFGLFGAVCGVVLRDLLLDRLGRGQLHLHRSLRRVHAALLLDRCPRTSRCAAGSPPSRSSCAPSICSPCRRPRTSPKNVHATTRFCCDFAIAHS